MDSLQIWLTIGWLALTVPGVMFLAGLTYYVHSGGEWREVEHQNPVLRIYDWLFVRDVDY
jgi:hypothetical protein